MQYLDHVLFRAELARVFVKYYDQDVADSLAIMHTQLHMKFARGMAQVAIEPGVIEHMVKAQSHISKAVQTARDETPDVEKMPVKGQVGAAALEVRDYMESVGKPVTMEQICFHLFPLGASRQCVMQAMRMLKRNGEITKPSSSTYELLKKS